jgi:hypothetical protein
MKRWLEKLRIERWTTQEIDDLKAELNRRHLIDPIFVVCADALGSLQYDVTDESAVKKRYEARCLKMAAVLHVFVKGQRPNGTSINQQTAIDEAAKLLNLEQV